MRPDQMPRQPELPMPTPGPWVVDNYGDVQANGEDVARIASDFDHAAADAALIAAAPDLLDALQEFAVQHQCGCGHPHCNDCARDAMADAALTKARAVPPNNQGNRRA